MTIQPKKLNCSKLAALATMCSFAAVLSTGASAAAVPKTATLIPAPHEIRATGGEYWEKKPPKLEKVAGLPPEGYELSITTNGITIRHSDDAGAYYAKMALFHTGRYDAKAKCKVYPCLEIRDWPQFRWRGVVYQRPGEMARKNVVGGQCCNWSTHTFCLDGLEWKMWPRGFALAEVLWTYPDPAKRDFKEFSERAANYRLRLIGAHVNCAPLK